MSSFFYPSRVRPVSQKPSISPDEKLLPHPDALRSADRFLGSIECVLGARSEFLLFIFFHKKRSSIKFSYGGSLLENSLSVKVPRLMVLCFMGCKRPGGHFILIRIRVVWDWRGGARILIIPFCAKGHYNLKNLFFIYGKRVPTSFQEASPACKDFLFQGIGWKPPTPESKFLHCAEASDPLCWDYSSGGTNP
jgi:hypothetical protein